MHWDRAKHSSLCGLLMRNKLAPADVKRSPVTRRNHSYKNLAKAQEKYDQMDGLWQTISRWNENSDSWMNEPFTSINAEAVNSEVQVFVKDAFSAHKKVRRAAGGLNMTALDTTPRSVLQKSE